MIENVLNKIGGVGMFGVISICIFFAFFTGMVIWLVCLKKSYLDSMCKLPLDRDPAPESKSRKPLNSQNQYE